MKTQDVKICEMPFKAVFRGEFLFFNNYFCKEVRSKLHDPHKEDKKKSKLTPN